LYRKSSVLTVMTVYSVPGSVLNKLCTHLNSFRNTIQICEEKSLGDIKSKYIEKWDEGPVSMRWSGTAILLGISGETWSP
jgi:hypothetical protein